MNQSNREIFQKHAVSRSPNEACAVLIDEDGVEKLVICNNISTHKFQFIIDPIDYIKAENRGRVIGIVHSHVLTPIPSEADIVGCEKTNVPWHIFGVHTKTWSSISPNGYKAPLVGRTWSHGVLDCYSLIKDYYKEELGIEIPDYDRSVDWWKNGENLYHENYKSAGFIDIDIKDLKKNDCVLMQIRSPVINHAAVYLGNEIILHHCHNRLSSKDILGGFWMKHVVKAVRHKDLL